jgi:hypothetical protein
MKSRTKALSLAFLVCLAMPAFSEVRFDLDAVIGNDFIGSPSIHQAVQALKSENTFGGFQWEAIVGKFGIGGDYLTSST